MTHDANALAEMYNDADRDALCSKSSGDGRSRSLNDKQSVE
jgi:hypothetical protein